MVNKKFLKSRFLGASKPFLGDRYIHVTVRHMLQDRCLSCLSVTLVYCGQTVGWIRMPLGTEVGLGPGHIVLDGYLAPPRKGAQQPLTSAHFALARSPISATAELLLEFRCRAVTSFAAIWLRLCP